FHDWRTTNLEHDSHCMQTLQAGLLFMVVFFAHSGLPSTSQLATYSRPLNRAQPPQMLTGSTATSWSPSGCHQNTQMPCCQASAFLIAWAPREVIPVLALGTAPSILAKQPAEPAKWVLGPLLVCRVAC